MKPLSAFYDLLLPELPGAGTPMVDAQLQAVAREFCSSTSAWRAPFDPVATVAGTATYDLSPSEAQSEVVRLLRVAVNGVLLWDPAWTPDSAGVTPKYAADQPPFTVSADLSEITLTDEEVPTAAQAGGLAIDGAMTLKAGAQQLPDFLFTIHFAAIRAGVLARMMRMGKKPWTDRELSNFYETEYQAGLAFAANVAQRGNTRAPLRVRKWG